MKTIIINDHKELYERLADAELFFYIENDGKTITFESPVNKYYDPLKKLGYGFYGNFAKYVYHLNENEYLTDIIHGAFVYYQECYNKQIRLKIKELEERI